MLASLQEPLQVGKPAKSMLKIMSDPERDTKINRTKRHRIVISAQARRSQTQRTCGSHGFGQSLQQFSPH